MDVVKENIPIEGEEAVRNGKLASSATMVTPRKPLMDLAQVPRTTIDDPKLMKPGMKSTIITPIHTPQLKKTFSKKLEPSALIYEDKTDTCSSSHSTQNTTKDTVKLVDSTYLDKLRKSAEDKMIDNFVSQVIDKCVADIQIDTKNVDRTGAASNGTDTNQNSEVSLVSDVSNAKDHTCDIEEQRHNATDTEQNSEVRTLGQNDKSEDHTCNTEQQKDSANLIDHVQENVHGNLVDHLYCASDVEEYQDNKHSVTDNGVKNNLERNSDHNYCVNDSTYSDTTVNEELSDSNSVCKVVLNADECSSDHAVIDDLQNVGDTFKDCYCLMEEGEYFIDKSNISRPDYTDLEFIELEVSDETCKTEVDAECTPEINLGCETEMEREVINDADVDSDANSSLLCQFSKDIDNINLSITEEMSAPVCSSMDLNCGVLNPQGVTYMVSPKSNATAMTSTWKQSITSPDCTKNTFQLPKAEEIVEVAYKDCQANLERDPGRKSNSDCLDQLSVNSVQHTSLVTEKTGSDDTDRLSVKDTMSVKVCDAYVQSKPDFRSATNSPFVPYDTHSASTSPFVPYETHSATTSPFIPYTTHTTSVNTDIVETADAEVGTELPPTIYVNIIKDQPEVKSISVSTDESFDTETETGTCLNRSVDLITKESISLNKEINHNNAVSASTDLPDYSMKNTMTETADIGVGAIVDTVDIGVEVQPTVVTVSTEMTELPMSTVGTSMTPLKMQHKNGKRTTAEDIRKQHPRVLANEFDSLKQQNERLETNVKSLEHEKDKLRSSLKETKGSLHKLEKEMAERDNGKEAVKDKIWELANRCEELENHLQSQMKTSAVEVELLQTRCQELELEKNRQSTEHADQMQKLKEEYEETNYRDHFLASQKLVQQQQAELSEYSQMMEDIEQSQQIQTKLEAKMSESFSKVKLAEEAVMSRHRDLQAGEVELSGQRSDLERREAALREGEAEIVREREQIQEIVRCYQLEAAQLDEQFKKSCEDLAVANNRLEVLDIEIHNSHTELTQCKEDKGLLEEKFEANIQREISLQRELELLQITLKQKEDHELATNTRLTELEELLQQETEAKKHTHKQSSLEIVNLQHTLESREQDIDSLEKDLFECREIIYSQMEKLRVSEEQQKSTDTELKSVVAENLELKGCCAALRGKEQELGETLKYTQEELSGTREHASRLLKEQGNEMADCSTVIGQLTDHMASVLTSLNQKAGIQKTPVKSVEKPMKSLDPDAALDLSKPPHDAQQSQGSLVSLILKAARSRNSKEVSDVATDSEIKVSENSADQEDETNHVDGVNPDLGAKNEEAVIDLSYQTSKQALDNVDSPTTLSRKKLGFSGTSAFAPVRAGGQSIGCIKPKSGPLSSASMVQASDTQVSAEVRVIDNVCNKPTVDQSGVNTQTDTETDSLPEQVKKLSETFEEINRLVVLLEKASRSALQDIRRDNEELNCRVSQFEFTERRLNTDLEYSRKELQQYRDAKNDLEGKLEQMSDRLGLYIETEAEVKRLQQEIGHLHGKLQSLEAEKEFLNDQMNELLVKLEDAQSQTSESAQSSVVDINTQKEILTLQKKVHRLKEQLQERQDYIEEVSNKAARRIQKLEDNWKKADSEVLRFDELVDVIREKLVKSDTLIRDSEEIRKIIRLIDGKESLSSLKRSDKLKPIKTSLV